MAEVHCPAPAAKVSSDELNDNTITNCTISEFNSLTDAQRTRARKRWDLVKQIASSSRGYKVGEGTSMSTAEAKFLTMITKNMIEMDRTKYVEEMMIAPSTSSESNWKREDTLTDGVLRKVAADKRGRRGTGIFNVVKAAVAKERMRQSISDRLSELSGPEIKFLTALVNSDDVTSEQLNNALDTLDNDPMYNPEMWEGDQDDIFAIAVVGEEDVETRRWITLNKQFKLFDSNVSTRMLDCSEELDSSRRTRHSSRRRSSVFEATLEADVWKVMLDQSVHSSQITDSELITGVVDDSKDNKSVDSLESKSTHSTRHVKRLSSRAGDAIDPLLNAIPFEVREEQEDTRCPLQCPENSERKRSYMGMLSDTLIQPFICCGMNEVTIDAEEKTSDLVEEDFDSLESKKRFLRLDIEDSNNHTEQLLSTWLGSPEDYPILGLEKIEVNGRDPLDPHVLSPLLMKCLRDHLPYALREENFWLKYSLVRDGASLDVIFKNLRHSQHSVLAIETTQGEVFGSFTGHPWRNNGNSYYGSCDAFVWNLRKKRDDGSCNSLDEYILRESTLDVFPWASKGGNRNVQLSNPRKLFVGGGEPDDDVLNNAEKYRQRNSEMDSDEKPDAGLQWGMALALDKDLLFGTSTRCATFGSSPLIGSESDSEVFEILNMEIWVSACFTS